MHLVTTAIEDTWPKNTSTPILFLGEWCKLYSRKSHWQNLDYSMLPYHWDDREKLDRDYHYLDGIYEKLIPIISEKLNVIHNVNYSTRYWRILIGPWLLYFIQILFDRWFMLQNVGRAESVTIIDSGDNSFVPNDMEEFTSFYSSDAWNEYLYSQIIVRQQLISTISKITPQKRVVVVKKSSLSSFVNRCINRVSKLVSKDEGYFFYLDYIPVKTLIRIQLKLNQIPLLWRSIATPRVAIDPEKRKWSLNIEISDDFLSILSQLIPLQMPSVYLEGYAALKTLIKESEWPAKPKAIFTSNAYSADDYFKAWAAEKTSGGTSLIIGQHGGHFGTSPIESYAKHQYLIADRWLSWGWIKEGLSSIKPVGNLKIIIKSKLKCKPSGFALLVEAEYPRFSYNLYCVPISSQYIKYLENQYEFLRLLPDNIFQEVVLKPYPTDFGWGSASRFRDLFPKLNIDTRHQPIKEIMSQARICIVTYNATTLLECFAWDVPTLIFWDPVFWELNIDAQPFFDLLAEAKIFHISAESAAYHLKDIWDDVDSWWNDDKTRKAVDTFCKKWNVLDNGVLERLTSEIRSR